MASRRRTHFNSSPGKRIFGKGKRLGVSRRGLPKIKWIEEEIDYLTKSSKIRSASLSEIVSK
jgi:hypothetical protein